MDNEISLDTSQKLVFDILKFYKNICDKNGLKYYIAYGTLIGAVRHKGFIPWDDDIDVFMPRKDYIKLVEIMKNLKGRYQLVSFEVNKKFTAPLPKIIDTDTILIQQYDLYERVKLGLYIDIFIIDNAGDSYEEASNFYRESYSVYTKWFKSDLKLFLNDKSKIHSILGFIKRLPYKIKGISHYLTKFNEVSEINNLKKTDYVAITNSGSSKVDKNIFLASDFGEGMTLEFEDFLFRAPKNYEKLLSVEYGNYMELPPKNKQVSHHSYKLYWNNSEKKC